MLRLKSREELGDSAFMVCNIYSCYEEAEKLWSTETNVIDICERHYNLLKNEAFISWKKYYYQY